MDRNSAEADENASCGTAIERRFPRLARADINFLAGIIKRGSSATPTSATATAAHSFDRDPMNKLLSATAVALALALAGALVSPPPARANSYTLKCTTSTGEPAADLTIDLDRMMMSWGVPNAYKITKITDRYITAIQNEAAAKTDVGSEIWVLDRVTGDYKRASVAMICKESSCRTSAVLEAHTYFGRCARAMF